MARPRTEIDLPQAEAKFVLEALYRDGHISRATLAQYRARFESEIKSIESRLAHLKSLVGGLAPAAAGAAVATAVPALVRAARKARASRKAVRRASDSPERTAARKLQGRYLGLLRQVPAGIKKRFGKDAIAAKGKEAVVTELQAYLDSSKGSAKSKKK